MLRSMRLPPEGTLLGGPEVAMMKPAFPYGLTLNLDEDSIKLLNLGKLPEVGAVMSLQARVIVKSKSERQEDGRGEIRSLELQITDMELEGGSEKRDAATLIYSEDS